MTDDGFQGAGERSKIPSCPAQIYTIPAADSNPKPLQLQPALSYVLPRCATL